MEFGWKVLPDVSRSFALTIPFIEQPYKNEIMVGYLEARVLDTFEDSPVPFSLKQRAMNLWIEALRQERLESLHTVIDQVLDYVPSFSYRFLVEKADWVLKLHNQMSCFFKRAAVRWFGEMKDGMLEYSDKPIVTFDDLDEYCYYVAGVVGLFLTDVVGSREKFRIGEKEIQQYANDFGLFLQKVNITRDVREDALNDRFFWPQMLIKDIGYDGLLKPENEEEALTSLNKMVDNALKHKPNAEKYIELISPRLGGYKKFCYVNYKMAEATLLLCKDNPDVFYSEKPVKISRKEVQQFISEADELFF